jgi:hypothetical protein
MAPAHVGELIFLNMIAEVEKGKGFTFDEYHNKVNQWLKTIYKRY